MGIKKLSDFIRKKFPDAYEEAHISEYAFHRVAIDISIFLIVFKVTYQDKWLNAFIKLVECLRKNELHCVFIYDSGAPPEKKQERENRAASKQKLKTKIEDVSSALEEFETNGTISDNLLEFQRKRNIQVKLLGNTGGINVKGINAELKKMNSQNFHLSESDFLLTKKLFDILQVPYYDAPLEAETMCSDLCKRGLVEAVLSKDTDVLAYGAPSFLTNLNTFTGICYKVKIEKLLEEMELTYNEFLDFCIMCGTDYNENIPNIGPVKAYQLIKEFSSLEKIKESGIDISILNHERVRELFTCYEKKKVKISYCGTPDFIKLEEFIFENNIRINVEDIKKSFTHNIVVYED